MRQRQPLGRASAGGMSQIEDKGGGSRWPGRGRTWPAIAVGPVMGFDSLSWKSSDATGRSGMKWDKILRHACFGHRVVSLSSSLSNSFTSKRTSAHLTSKK